ncbi:cytochrome ubiquinol oxidase subunit I [Xylanimonas ulmi]|uniref:Cytochrome bd-I ubiquinol oxidase subunit 1 apoprotein n=1 Tax=Xylanimonas ulmi TaxID=228973 RepID=A0A4Q7M4Q4_9MICO|nr:cytochrome ubiquinol oxidase subunit I [Xylanibacterium ulmi]RZS61917.1 cytochrome bd-I ubiquinol oxidase subunit 1 apoprotein [Xylanibacterium ulmi]
MQTLDLARWQFAITTVYHFIFVPLTIGLAPLVAGMQTAWVRTGDEKWLRLTRFFGKLLLINFALGVVTGIVQEFQFGMAWSGYSRTVGDIFGAPLAMEALAAFFIESTFLGLWIFGWDRLSKRAHLVCIWLFAFAVNLSAFFIIAANSWMQHPVGAVWNAETGRAEMDDFAQVLTNSTLWGAFPHTVTASFLTAGTFMAGIALYWMVRLGRTGKAEAAEHARRVYRPALRIGVVTMVVAGLGVAWTGDYQGKLMFEQQPAKMAAAEAICGAEGEEAVGLSLLSVGLASGDCENVSTLLAVPGLASFLATGSFTGPDSFLPSVPQVQGEREAQFGAVDEDGEPIAYTPPLAITFWSFRLMIATGLGSVALALVGWWMTRKDRVPARPWVGRLAVIAIFTPFLGAAFGWIFTEVGRQPWVVAPNPTGIDEIRLLTARGVSDLPPGVVLTSMVVLTLVYGVLAMAWGKLMHRYVVEGANTVVRDVSPSADDPGDTPLSFAY